MKNIFLESSETIVQFICALLAWSFLCIQLVRLSIKAGRSEKGAPHQPLWACSLNSAVFVNIRTIINTVCFLSALFIIKLLGKDRYYIIIHNRLSVYIYRSTIPPTPHIANYCTTWNTLWIFHISVCSSNNKKQYFVLQTESVKVIYFHL